MEEYSKIKWRVQHPSELEVQACFITDEVVTNSRIYSNFEKRIKFDRIEAMPMATEKFVPGSSLYYRQRKSALDEWQHDKCLKAFKLQHSARDPLTYSESERFYMKTYSDLQQDILNENKLYQEFAQSQWEKDLLFLNKIKSTLFHFAKSHWISQCKRYLSYPPHYKDVALLNMTFGENEAIIDFKCEGNVLELGTMARFSHPNFKLLCCMQQKNLPKFDIYHNTMLNSKLPVSKDENVQNILKNCDVDLVISNSALKCLTDMDVKAKWTLPVIVKKISKIDPATGKEYEKNVVFVDNVLPNKNPNKFDFTSYCMKVLLKTTFCQYEAFKYNNQEATINKDTASDEEETEKAGPRKKEKPKTHHNAVYRIWNITRSDNHNNLMKSKVKATSMNILVRNKIAACEIAENGALQPLVIRPKLERQLMLGANICSKSELSREWTSLFFIPYSNLYRARIHPHSGEVVSLEKCTIQKVMTQSWVQHEMKPNLGLGILQKIFAELIKLTPGNYMLNHLPKHEAFVSLMKECGENEAVNLDLVKQHEECAIEPMVQIPWLPIDVNYVLPVFEANNRMPAMFAPKENKQKVFKKKKGKNNRAKKQKLETE